MERKMLLFLIAIIGLFALAACGGDKDTEAENNSAANNEANNNNNASDGDSYVIGATQILEHPSLDAATDGFKAALEEAGLDFEWDYQNAQNDQNNVKTIADNFVADDVDLIFANSTPSALGALNATDDIPIVFTSVTDAADIGIDEMESPGGNITGVVDLHPDAIESTVEFIDQYFEGAKVGLIYNAGEKNSVTQIDAVNAAAEGTSLSTEERTVSNSSEVQQAANSIAGEVDAFYIITDNTVVSALDAVVGIAEDQQIPLFVGEPDSLAGGGFATFGIDYYTIGQRSGEMAAEILTEGKNPGDLDVEYPEEIELIVNKEAAEAQGIEWNDDWDDAADLFEDQQ